MALGGCVPKKYIKGLMVEGLSDGLYDYTDDLISDEAYRKMLGENCIVKSKYGYRFEEGDEEYEGNEKAIGVCLGNYLLTAKHAVCPANITTQMMTPFGIQNIEVPIVINDDRYYLQKDDPIKGELIEIPKVYCGGSWPEGDDLILCELPERYTKDTTIGDSDEMHIGHLISAIGNVYSVGKQVISSRVSSLKVPDEWKGIASGGNVNNYIVVTDGLEPGCSGGGNYAFRDGEPELIGMGQLKGGILGAVLKINYIKGQLKQYLRI